MQITYQVLDQNHKVIEKLASLKIESFKTKIKLVKVQKWLETNAEILTKFLKEITEEFNIKEKFEFNEEGKFIGEDVKGVTEAVLSQRNREGELLAELIDTSEITFTEEELEDLDLTSDDILKLNKLGLFVIE